MIDSVAFTKKYLVILVTVLTFILIGCGQDTKKSDNAPPTTNMQSSSVTTTKPSVGQKDNWHKVEDEKGRSTGYILLDQITYGVNSNGNANRNLITTISFFRYA